MACFYPLTGYRAKTGRLPNGKWPIVFSPKEGYIDMPVTIPCGQCIGCRLEYSRQWAIRCIHEASLYENNCFITLTYNDENLPWRNDNGELCVDKSSGELLPTLNKRDFQLFMKRLRKKYGEGIRFFQCGEYGSLGRPHHHAILFNFEFPDKELWSIRHGVKLYRSPRLEQLWPFGFSTIGEVTYESAAYVARYIMKKVKGDKADEYYCGRQAEYITMSRRPGIAREWYEKWKGDVYPHDYVVIRNGLKCRPPKYYDYLFDIENEEGFLKVKSNRIIRLKDWLKKGEDGPDRRAVREECLKLRVKRLVRSLD